VTAEALSCGRLSTSGPLSSSSDSSMNPQGYIWLAVGSAILVILLLTGLLKYGLA
jgi:hypothetical protein